MPESGNAVLTGCDVEEGKKAVSNRRYTVRAACVSELPGPCGGIAARDPPDSWRGLRIRRPGKG